MEKEKYYITTPIYYPSGKWHIGTCYTTIICDALARFKRLDGYDVFFLTGTDEHGQKIQKAAQAAGKTEKEYLDAIVGELRNLWGVLGISYDKFIRTTEEYHKRAIQKIFTALYEKGDIYKNEYEGWYCVPCESFWTKSQLVDGKCPDCGREVQLTKEESYFFRLSKYQKVIEKLFQDNPTFLMPKSRQNEMINNFLKPGLQDLCVSRTTFDWGIQVPFDTKHVVYVWLDALFNYATALGYMGDDDALFRKYWPADVHMMAKEIVRFHSIIWPAFISALDLPLPGKVFGHGWIMFGSDKMSKSKGNVVDPFILSDRYGADALRYYILRAVPFGQDGVYSNEMFVKTRNSDLANTLGNLVSRTLAMVNQYFGQVPAPCGDEGTDAELKEMNMRLYGSVKTLMDEPDVSGAMDAIWEVLHRANKYIDECEPWVLAKDESKKARLGTVLYNLTETIRRCAVLLQAFMPDTADKILQSLDITGGELRSFASLDEWGAMPVGGKVIKGEPLFARLDLNKELKELDAIAASVASAGKSESAADSKKGDTDKAEGVLTVDSINIEDFEKIELRVGTIVDSKRVEKTDKLLCSQIDLGEGKPRTIVSGIAKYYAPEDIIGKQVIVVSNLKPVKLRGILSEGMVLCASDAEGNLTLITPSKGIASGSEVR
ncbi:MAG: methionine--tRNA ligase [Clostridia bacterium]|nr:methionine--tRNA ligase [Clostridia bacterium]